MKPLDKLSLESHLKELRLPSVLREYAKTAADASKEALDYEGYLLRLAAVEVADREARTFLKRLRLARLPAKKTLADFDFKAIPDLDPLAVHRLAGCEFVDKAERASGRIFRNWEDASCDRPGRRGVQTPSLGSVLYGIATRGDAHRSQVRARARAGQDAP